MLTDALLNGCTNSGLDFVTAVHGYLAGTGTAHECRVELAQPEAAATNAFLIDDRSDFGIAVRVYGVHDQDLLRS